MKADPSSNSELNNSRKITLTYTIVPARHSDNKKEPIIYLAYRAGISGLFSMKDILENEEYFTLRGNHDFIVLDYRGTGFSLPYPKCEGNNTVENISKCFEELNSTIRLSDYTSKNIANDINQLLIQEKIEKANLLGVAYGTTVALTVARDFPLKVNRLILDSLFPIEINRLSQAKEGVLYKLKKIKTKYDQNKSSSDPTFDQGLETLLNKNKERNNTNNHITDTLLLLRLSESAYKSNLYEIVKKYFTDVNTTILDEDNSTFNFHKASYNTSFKSLLSKVEDNNTNLRSSRLVDYSVVIQEELSFIEDSEQEADTFGFDNSIVSILDSFTTDVALLTLFDLKELKLKFNLIKLDSQVIKKLNETNIKNFNIIW